MIDREYQFTIFTLTQSDDFSLADRQPIKLRFDNPRKRKNAHFLVRSDSMVFRKEGELRNDNIRI